MLRAILLAPLLASMLAASPVTSNVSCSPDLAAVGACSVSNSGSQVDITAGLTQPGAQGTGGGQNNDSDSHNPGTPEQPPAEPEECGPLGCRGNYDVISIPDVTLADIASFRPAQPTLTGEPAGFGVVGMPANLVAAASEQRIPGTVLGWDVTVRFVPAAFVFSHGDGTTSTTATGGASWSALGQPQFSPTATSHVYRARGTFPVSVTVRYAASVDFGNGVWRTVPGFVEATTGGYDVRVVEVRTALVDETCVENPAGPGC